MNESCLEDESVLHEVFQWLVPSESERLDESPEEESVAPESITSGRPLHATFQE